MDSAATRRVLPRVAAGKSQEQAVCVATCAATRPAARVRGNGARQKQGRAAVPDVRANGGARTTRNLWRVACWRGVKEGGAGGEKEWGGKKRVEKEGGKDARSNRGPAFTPCTLGQALQWRKVQCGVSPYSTVSNLLFFLRKFGNRRRRLAHGAPTFLAKCLHPGHPLTLLRLLRQLATLPPLG